jgi:hypothetical protein
MTCKNCEDGKEFVEVEKAALISEGLLLDSKLDKTDEDNARLETLATVVAHLDRVIAFIESNTPLEEIDHEGRRKAVVVEEDKQGGEGGEDDLEALGIDEDDLAKTSGPQQEEGGEEFGGGDEVDSEEPDAAAGVVGQGVVAGQLAREESRRRAVRSGQNSHVEKEERGGAQEEGSAGSKPGSVKKTCSKCGVDFECVPRPGGKGRPRTRCFVCQPSHHKKPASQWVKKVAW